MVSVGQEFGGALLGDSDAQVTSWLPSVGGAGRAVGWGGGSACVVGAWQAPFSACSLGPLHEVSACGLDCAAASKAFRSRTRTHFARCVSQENR